MNVMQSLAVVVKKCGVLILNYTGYESFEHAAAQILMIKNSLWTLGVILTSLSFALFVENWVFAPRMTYFVFIGMTVAESVFGAFRAVKTGQEKFNLDKAMRIIPKILAHTFLLSASWHLSKSDDLLSWLPSTTFLYFSIHNFLKIIIHLTELKWVEGDFANFIRKKLTDNNAANH